MSEDYCSCAPDLNFGATCCKQHDVDYSVGIVTRAEADRRLRVCIQKKGYIVLPWIYWIAVRLFGATHYKHKVLSMFPSVNDVKGAKK